MNTIDINIKKINTTSIDINMNNTNNMNRVDIHAINISTIGRSRPMTRPLQKFTSRLMRLQKGQLYAST